MEEIIKQLFDFLSVELTVILTVALPVIELRVAIPVGISLGLSPIHSLILSFIGSMIPVPIILFTIRPIFNYLKKTKMFKNIVHRLTKKSLNKSGNIKKKGQRPTSVDTIINLFGEENRRRSRRCHKPHKSVASKA